MRGGLHDYFAKRSLIPNDPVIDTACFPWAAEFAARWPEIREELDAQLLHRAQLPSFQEISPDQYRISPDDQWKAFVLVGFGDRSDLNCSLCPATAAALARVPGLQTAFFSVLAPGKRIPEHRGITKAAIRAHLALRVPERSAECWMECGGRRVEWREGEALFFDDTYPHAVWNNTAEERAVLLFDFERPMTSGGRRLARAMNWVFRRTAYVKDAQRNQRAWESRYRAFLGR